MFQNPAKFKSIPNGTFSQITHNSQVVVYIYKKISYEWEYYISVQRENVCLSFCSRLRGNVPMHFK